jgi:3D (Asp-Asp-Asp) domain-containing protein
MLRYAFPVLIVLSTLNLYTVLKPVDGDGSQPKPVSREYRFSMEKDLELLKAQDEIQILKMFLDRYKKAANQKDLELSKAQEENLVLNAILHGYKEANTHHLRLSAYTARTQECNDDPENTAIMQAPKPGWTVAVSHDLKGWLGKRVYIQGFGVRLVNDLMHSRYSKSIDVLVGKVSTAKSIGIKNNVLVTLIEPYAVESEMIDIDAAVSLKK